MLFVLRYFHDDNSRNLFCIYVFVCSEKVYFGSFLKQYAKLIKKKNEYL